MDKATEVAEGLLQRKSTLEILTTKDGLHDRFSQLNQVKMDINPEVIVKGKFIPSEVVSALPKLGHLEKTVSGMKVKNTEVKGSASVGSSASRPSVSQAGPREFVPVKVIGKKGRGCRTFNGPRCVAVNVELNEIAVTNQNCRIQIFDRAGNYSRQFGQKLSGQEMFKLPLGIVYDKHNNILVSDSHNHTVSVFTAHGTFLRNLATNGNQDGQVRDPQALSVTDS